MKKLCVLGITGSIGQNVSSICLENKQDFEITGVCFNSQKDEFIKIYQKHPTIKYVGVNNQDVCQMLKKEYPHLLFFTGDNFLIKLLDVADYDLVVNALVGFRGLEPTIHCLNKGIDLALANKESLVVGGELIKKILKTSKSHLYPIDSEHVALSKLIKSHSKEDIDSLIITASGGSFRDLTRDQLENVTINQALNHPSWSMGDKITIDSATMMNKGFEIIEAYYLFDVPLNKIQVLLHDESVIHSLIKMKDNSMLADIGPADMRIPILYALYEEKYHDFKLSSLSLEEMGTLHFRKYDSSRYPAVELCKKALELGGTYPCVLNASNEVCNIAFRKGLIKFNQIEDIISRVINLHQTIENPTLDDYILINEWASKQTLLLIEKGDLI